MRGVFAAALCSTLLAGADALGSSTPRRVGFRTLLEFEDGGILELRGVATETGARFAVRARQLPTPRNGDLHVVLSSPEDGEIDLGALTALRQGRFNLFFDSPDDLRALALAADTLTVLDGDTPVETGGITAAADVRLAARLRLDGEHSPGFEIAGRVVRRTDGTGTFEFVARARGAAPGAYELRLEGGGAPFVMTLQVEGRLTRKVLQGDDEILLDALTWTDFVIVFEGDEIGRAEIACR